MMDGTILVSGALVAVAVSIAKGLGLSSELAKPMALVLALVVSVAPIFGVPTSTAEEALQVGATALTATGAYEWALKPLLAWARELIGTGNEDTPS